ncbi:calcium-binding protein [Oryzibacter oryziterrae]|uniref:calcium-binding protein n=1 Tax=Oryzibacter oryziterrae TaxID=2766474 RepID=UPI00272C1949|nr:calcium-binding protein [Oryzibacter oryziterrae]
MKSLCLLATTALMASGQLAFAGQCETKHSSYSDIVGDCYTTSGGKQVLGNRADTLIGNPGEDHIWGYKLNDDIRAGGGNDQAWGGPGNDTIIGEGGRDVIDGEDGNDSLDGGSDNDDLYGGKGNDTLHGREGADELYGADGDDTLFGDLPEAAAGFGGVHEGDTFHPGNGVDTMTGTSGYDDFQLDADTKAGSNTLHAGGGTDVAKGGLKADYAWMEGGNDTVEDNNNGAADRWNGGLGSDSISYYHSATGVTIDLTKGKHQGPGGDTITGFEQFVLSQQSDSLRVDYEDADTASTKVGSAPNYLLIITGTATSSKKGDFIEVKGPAKGAKLPKASKGALIAATDGNDTVFGGDLTDDILLMEGDDTGVGGGGDDLIQGGDGDDTLRGEAGKDTLFGATGADTLVGGDGGDMIDCGLKGVTSGGKPIHDDAADTVVFNKVSDSMPSKPDIITSFHPAKDRIDLSRVDANSKVAGVQHFKIVNAFTGAAGELMVTYDPSSPEQPLFTLMGNTAGTGVDFMVMIGFLPGNWGATKPASFIILK